MYNVRNITDDLFYIGCSDRRLNLFENVYPIANGMAYNSYFLNDEKTVLFDTVDKRCCEQFFANLNHVLGGRKLDYLIVNHMEPDHCALIADVVSENPDVKIVCNAKTAQMLGQFFDMDLEGRLLLVKEGDTLETGHHTLQFFMAPMVHWPEVMVTYDSTDKILFSADAFGTFGAINGNIFADEVDFERDYLDEARRYYTNIVGKFGVQVQALLKKAAGLEIKMLCPLHGLIWRENLGWYIDKYNKWSSYTPEDNSVMIAYASVYGGTENAVDLLAGELAKRGIKNIKIYNTSLTHPSVILSEAFRCSHLVFASVTYNMGIFSTMNHLIHELAAHNLQNRSVALIENGSWSCCSAKLMREEFEKMKNITLLDSVVTLKSTMNDANMEEIVSLAQTIADSIKTPQSV